MEASATLNDMRVGSVIHASTTCFCAHNFKKKMEVREESVIQSGFGGKDGYVKNNYLKLFFLIVSYEVGGCDFNFYSE